MSLADRSAYNYYSDYVEKGYYNRIIAGNITQVLQVDSIVADFNDYPYQVRTYARQMIIRQSNVTESRLSRIVVWLTPAVPTITPTDS